MDSKSKNIGVVKKTLSLGIGLMLLSQVVNAQIAMIEPAQLQPKQPLISVNFVRTPLPKALHSIAKKHTSGCRIKRVSFLQPR